MITKGKSEAIGFGWVSGLSDAVPPSDVVAIGVVTVSTIPKSTIVDKERSKGIAP